MSLKGQISKERKMKCESCGKKAETRPYGPGGKRVCFDCGMKDEAQAKRMFRQKVLGEKLP